ncbi:hypothetical protein QBC38DRAFT_548415 [Podospora fimiseda]|uniref:Uncharacterized protein n=1 Tax=Podospora fimiseda TaxID=252190 RepID=A0AAN7GSE9_9PEZI|nr:hypothetical protein QBC38DRAFT_548415 [Podospora fimiseda]
MSANTHKTMRSYVDAFRNSPAVVDFAVLTDEVNKITIDYLPLFVPPATTKDIKERLRWICELESFWQGRVPKVAKPGTNWNRLNNYQLAALISRPVDTLKSDYYAGNRTLERLMVSLEILCCLLKRLFFVAAQHEGNTIPIANIMNAAEFRKAIQSLGIISKEEEPKVAILGGGIEGLGAMSDEPQLSEPHVPFGYRLPGTVAEFKKIVSQYEEWVEEEREEHEAREARDRMEEKWANEE